MTPPDTKIVPIRAGTNKLTLFGSFDHHIKMIETAFQIEVSARGAEIRLSGEAAQITMAESAFLQLMALAGSDMQLSEEDVQHAIDSVRGVKEGEAPKLTLTESHEETITVAGKRRNIRPKSRAQKDYIQLIRTHDVVVGIGPAGTGKTYLAMAMAVSALLKKEVKRIVLVRPAVEAGESLGFLPGTLVEKINPYLRPLYDALFDMMDSDQVNRYLDRGDIEIAPLAFMRGRTLSNAFIILDEAQNTTAMQMKMFLTRLGYNSKVVITGDVTQVDLPKNQVSGLIEIKDVLKDVNGVKFNTFKGSDVVRHHLVQDIIKAYERHKEKGHMDRPL